VPSAAAAAAAAGVDAKNAPPSGALPIGFAVRVACETLPTFAEAVQFLSTAVLTAPTYFSVVGAARNEAVVLTRSETTLCNTQQLLAAVDDVASPTAAAFAAATVATVATAPSSARGSAANKAKVPKQRAAVLPHLVQANMDHDDAGDADFMCSRVRTQQVQRAFRLPKGSAGNFGGSKAVVQGLLWKVLVQGHDVWDDQTIYGAVMCPASGEYVSKVANVW
jgi:hypothetical protein